MQILGTRFSTWLPETCDGIIYPNIPNPLAGFSALSKTPAKEWGLGLYRIWNSLCNPIGTWIGERQKSIISTSAFSADRSSAADPQRMADREGK